MPPFTLKYLDEQKAMSKIPQIINDNPLIAIDFIDQPLYIFKKGDKTNAIDCKEMGPDDKWRIRVGKKGEYRSFKTFQSMMAHLIGFEEPPNEPLTDVDQIISDIVGGGSL